MFSWKPCLSDSEVCAVLEQEFALRCSSLSPLPSERDQNVRVTTSDGRLLVFKASAHESSTLLTAQHAALALLAPLRCAPSVLPARTGQRLVVVHTPSEASGANEANGTNASNAPRASSSTASSSSSITLLVRVLSYEPGVPLALRPLRRAHVGSLERIAALVGRMDMALAPLDEPELHRTGFQWDLCNYADVIRSFRDFVEDEQFRSLVDRVFAVADPIVASALAQLPRSTIHGDLNTWNILVNDENDDVKLIDFGDMLWSITVADPAILIAYCLLDTEEDIEIITEALTRGYEQGRHLSDLERRVLFPLAALRLCTSAVVAAKQCKDSPDNEHLSLYQKHVRGALPKVLAHLLKTTTFLRQGELKDEKFYVDGVHEVLDLEGTFTWSDDEATVQQKVWRDAIARGGALVALDSLTFSHRGLVTWTVGSREAFCPPYGPDWPNPFVWIDVSYVAHHVRRGGLARLMYDQVGHHAKSTRGLLEMQLDVYHQNRASVAFHKAIGFRHFASVFRRLVVEEPSKPSNLFSFRKFSGDKASDVTLVMEGFAARSTYGAKQMFERLAAQTWIVEWEKNPVGCFHWSVSSEHPFGVSYGKYDYSFVFLDMILSKHPGVGRAVQTMLDLAAKDLGLKYVLSGVELSNAAAVSWLAKCKFEPYVCIFSRTI